MTPEEIRDRDCVWAEVAARFPQFTHAHDPADNYHAVREIVLSGSVTWAAANGYFKPWPGKWVLDIGANAGIYSAFCAIHGARVVAYEPFQQVYSLLVKMVDEIPNGDLITPINAAVWTFTGNIPYIGHKVINTDVTCYNGGVPTNGVRWTDDDFNNAVEVRCVSLDDAIGDRTWDCVKIDIEGAEYEMLLAASPEKLKQIKFCYLEFHHWTGSDPSLYARTIEKLESIFKCSYYLARGSEGPYEAAYLWRK
jgi:FkbM family methyltransferase